MASRSDEVLLVLLGLRLKGFAAPDAIGEVVELPADIVAHHLDAFLEKGWALYREGRMTGWSITPDGRVAGERQLVAELEQAGVTAAVRSCYDRFLELNNEMLAACTAWQMRDESTLNDHSDAAYDAGVIERLVDLHTAVTPVCGDLAAALARFASYGPRLGSALDKVRSGEHDWFTSVRLPSYHTVWFELHENLLASLGIDRAAEGH